MMATYLYRCYFEGPVHFGVAGIGMEGAEPTLSSDSIVSALVNAFSVLKGREAADRLVSELNSERPPFVLSSLFPFGPDKETGNSVTEALVRPLAPPEVESADIVRAYAKDLKKIKFLSLQDFLLWSGDRPLEEKELETIVSRGQELTEGWWNEELRPRVALDRNSQNSSIWSQAAIWFGKRKVHVDGKLFELESGLYGLVHFNDESWKESLAHAFRLLGDLGLGGERTYGFGLFRFGGFEEPNDLWRKVLSGSRRRKVLLSLYYPSEAERQGLAQDLEAWDFIEKRGYIVSGRNTTTIKRKRVRMLVEGTVARRNLRGTMVDVTPENAETLGIPHRVYRCGLAFMVPTGDG
ncbi:MAG: type III-A CRISPR-associated RAMP protein Csm4 [Candidatus Methanomethylicaceae archaeon]